MFGGIDHFPAIDVASGFIVGVSAVAAATDVLFGKIYNWLTLTALAAGLAWGLAHGGLLGVAGALAGAGIGLAAFVWMFALGFMGGGDVKLMVALGAWGGSRFAVETALLSVLLGGLLAALSLVVRGRMMAFGRKLYRFAVSMVIRELVVEPPPIDRKQTIPFGVPIAVAACWAAFANPFAAGAIFGGVLPW